jgi:hypothetical protein
VHAAGNPASIAAMLRRELARVDRRMAIVSMIELRDQVDASLVAERLTAKLSAAFGLSRPCFRPHSRKHVPSFAFR